MARKHLSAGTLVLLDVTSSYLEGLRPRPVGLRPSPVGLCCELARFGYSRDHRRDRPQIVHGLLCDRHGCPVAVEVFSGKVGDPSTLSAQAPEAPETLFRAPSAPVAKLKRRFRPRHVVLVGDRGLVTSARIREDPRPAGLDWITAPRGPRVRALVEAGPLRPDLFDERDLAEITAPDYPGERLVACRNAALAKERARK